MGTAAKVPGKRSVAGIGRVIGWPGGSLWIGVHLGTVQTHAHHAIQISLAMDGDFHIRAADWPQARAARGMVVMPDRPHSFDGRGASIATLFVEPNSRSGAALRERFAGFDVALLSDAETRAAVEHLQAQYADGADNLLLSQYAKGAICRVAGDPVLAPSDDPRITAALAWMRRGWGRRFDWKTSRARCICRPGGFVICSCSRPARPCVRGCCGRGWIGRCRRRSRGVRGPKRRMRPGSRMQRI